MGGALIGWLCYRVGGVLWGCAGCCGCVLRQYGGNLQKASKSPKVGVQKAWRNRQPERYGSVNLGHCHLPSTWSHQAGRLNCKAQHHLSMACRQGRAGGQGSGDPNMSLCRPEQALTGQLESLVSVHVLCDHLPRPKPLNNGVHINTCKVLPRVPACVRVYPQSVTRLQMS